MQTATYSYTHSLPSFSRKLFFTTMSPPTSPRSRSDSSSDIPLWSARLEILLVIWRVAQAIKALPAAADDTTVSRWNAGIERELARNLPQDSALSHFLTPELIQWIAIRAMGISAAANVMRSGDSDSWMENCDALKILLGHARWEGRDMGFDVRTLDKTGFLALAEQVDPAQFGSLADSAGYPKWWTWGVRGPGTACPVWWMAPPNRLVTPVLLLGIWSKY